MTSISSPSTIVLAGGTGFLGEALAEHLYHQGYEIVVLTRRVPVSTPPIPIRYVHWDGVEGGPWEESLEGAYALINLAGVSVDCRYTASNRERILNSRLRSTRALGLAIQGLTEPPQVWLNSSSATIYADTRGDALANGESSKAIGHDFSMHVCQSWEECFRSFYTPHTRKASLRTAITLGEGSAMKPLMGLVKLGLGGSQGPGSQWMSWIHVHDFVRAVQFLLEKDVAIGAFNLAAPNPLPNQAFMAILRETMGINWGLPLPTPLLKLGAWLIRTEAELLLKSRKVIPTRLLEAGFRFQYPTASEALGAIVAGQTENSQIPANHVLIPEL